MKIFDHIHGYIKICKDAKKIIDTSEFQRLRNIKQLGCVYYVFPSASHNRFEHSLGVYNLSRKYMDILNLSGEYFNKKQYKLISIAGLIHDIGHGPYSHNFDEFIKGKNHEYRSIEIFKFMNNKYKLNYSDDDIKFINNVIEPNYNVNNYLFQIISNKNGFDVDRVDYMLRDIKMTGIENDNNIDNKFFDDLMNNSMIIHNEIYFKNEMMGYLDKFFEMRKDLYLKICNHKAVRSIEIRVNKLLMFIDKKYKIRECIDKSDWDRFCLLTDSIINLIEFEVDDDLNEAKQLLNDIKSRNNYKLIGEFTTNSIEEYNEFLNNYKGNNILDTSKISYYCNEYPKLINNNGDLIIKNKNKKDIYIIKIFDAKLQ